MYHFLLGFINERMRFKMLDQLQFIFRSQRRLGQEQCREELDSHLDKLVIYRSWLALRAAYLVEVYRVNDISKGDSFSVTEFLR